MNAPAKFSVAFKCPTCGQKGERNWAEGLDASHTLGSDRSYLNVSNGFHCEEGRAANGEPVIVCNICEEIQSD